MNYQKPLEICFRTLNKRTPNYYRLWVVGAVIFSISTLVMASIFEVASKVMPLLITPAILAILVTASYFSLAKLFEEKSTSNNFTSTYFPSLVGTRVHGLICRVIDTVYYGLFYVFCYGLLVSTLAFPVLVVFEYARR